MVSILELQELVNNLSEEDKEVFYRIFEISEGIGSLNPPKEMEEWIIKQFGSLEAIQHQKIIRVDNNITFEGALFNEIRAKRPVSVKDDHDINKIIEDNRGDPFCHPDTGTPEDTFGRIRGKESISCSNVAKFDAVHGVIVFNEHNPLVFDEHKIADYLETAMNWFRKANQAYPDNKYPYLMWNCLWKAGASLIHGHMQPILAKGRHYIGIEKLKKTMDDYKTKYGTKYFDDLQKLHHALGLGRDNIFCTITPLRDKETIIVANELNADTANKINRVLQAFFKLGVKSFNLGIYLPPLDKSWQDFPIIIRIIDRGDLNNKNSDMAGMEMFTGQNVIAFDPYKLIELL